MYVRVYEEDVKKAMVIKIRKEKKLDQMRWVLEGVRNVTTSLSDR